jgi:hypothetical protein
MTERDTLKSLAQLNVPDAVQAAFSRYDQFTGSLRPKSIEDHHSDARELALPDHVPQDIRRHFDTARNLFLYSWFVWAFAWVAQLYGYVSLEMALRLRALNENRIDESASPGLARLIKLAISEGWILVEELPQHVETDPDERAALEKTLENYTLADLARMWIPQLDPLSYIKDLAEAIPFFRNELAHGTTHISGDSFSTLLLCRDMISKLFPPSEHSPSNADA